jgi:hypothetical protein
MLGNKNDHSGARPPNDQMNSGDEAGVDPFHDGLLAAMPQSVTDWSAPDSTGILANLAPRAPTVSPAPALPTPDLTFTWAGTTELQQPADGTIAAGTMQPPDNNMAAGPNTIVTIVNDHIDIYNKTGTQHLSGQSLNALFGVPSSNFVFDPRVTWDQYYGRFIVVADDQTGSNSVIHIAVSKDSNPLNGWWTYNFNVKVGNSWLDQPNVGVDSTSLYFNGNYYDLSSKNFTVSELWAFDMNALAAGQFVNGFSYTDASRGAPPSNQFQYVPAHMYGSQSGLNGDFLVSYAQNNFGNDTLNIIRVSNAAQGNANFNIQSLNVGDISDADVVDARQQGSSTTIDAGDSRIEWAVWRNDTLYATNEIRIGSGSAARDVVHWFVVDTTNLSNLRLISQGNIDYGAGVDAYCGSMTVDSAGNMIFGYAYSGTASYASSVYAVIPAGGTGLQDSTFLTNGQGTYSGGRWGDYSGVALDPADNGSFWVFNQDATNQDSWATTIGGYHVPTYYALPVTAGDLEALQSGIQAFTEVAQATSVAAQIDSVPAGQTVTSYTNQLILNNQAFSQVAMATDALMFGKVDTVAEFNKLCIQFLPSQVSVARAFNPNATVFDAEVTGLALAGGNGSSNAFAANFGGLSVSAFAQATDLAVFGNTNLVNTIASFANAWIGFYSANPAATHGLSVTLASYGAAFGDTVGLALANPTSVGASLFAKVSNALIDNAEGILVVGAPLASQPVPFALQ